MLRTSSKNGERDISAIMRKVRSTGTSPEVALRRALAAKGLRIGNNGWDNLPGKPDIVLPEERIAIFIDGDFWHGGQWRRRKLASLEEQFETTPKKEYWVTKIRRNVNRDFGNTKKLLDEGWRVIRFWESQIRNDLESCVRITLDASKKKSKSDVCSIVPDRSVAEFFAGIGLWKM